MADDETIAPNTRLADLHTKWMGRLEAADKEMSEFKSDVKRVVRACGLDRTDTDRAKRRFEIAWANRDILQGAVYDRPPKGVVQSRYQQGDPLARAVSDVMERAINTNAELTGLHDALVLVRNEYVDFSRGTAWLRYEPTMERRQEPLPPGVLPEMLPEGMEIEEAEDGSLVASYEALTGEKVITEFVPRDLFRHGKAVAWCEVPWVARGKYYTEEEAKAQLPFWRKLDWKAEEKREGQPDKTVLVWEVWSRSDDRVFFLSPAATEVLDDVEPFLRLDGFYPCPPPAFGTLRDKKLVPIPDVVFYESQLQEINALTARINALLPALRVRGFYPGGATRDGADAIEQAIKANDDRQVMVPVPGWAAATGAKNLGIEWLPIDMVIGVLKACVEGRKQLIEDVYQITGISDIIRGDSNPNETLGAQQLKTQWGGLRLRHKQGEMVRFARDCCRIAAEIIADQFQPDTLMAMTQWRPPVQKQPAPPAPGEMPVPPEPAITFEDIMALLRDDRMRGYVIDVETDSTIVADEAQDKRDRIEFMQVMGQALTGAVPLISQAGPLAPEVGKIVGETLKFGVRGFRAGRELEQVIDDALGAIEQKLNAPPPPPTDPDAGKLEIAKINAEAKVHDTNTRAATEREKLSLEHSARAAEMAQADAHKVADAAQAPDPTAMMQ